MNNSINKAMGSPFYVALCTAFTVCLFSDEYKEYLFTNDWRMIIAFPLAIGFGGFLFACVAAALNSVVDLPKGPKRFEKSIKAAEHAVKYIAAVIVFVAAMYVGKNFI